MIKLIICDDEEHIIQQAKQYLLQVAKELSLELTIDTFLSGEDLLASYQPNSSSLIILDIEMKGLDGLATAKRLREQQGYRGLIIFLTNHERQLLTSEERCENLVLEKSAEYSTFAQQLKPILQKLAQDQQEFSFVTVEGAEITVLAQTILAFYTKRFQRGQTVHLKMTDRECTVKASLDQVEEQVAGSTFYRMNPYQLVNLKHVLTLGENYLLLTDQTKLKLQRKEKKALQDQLFQVD
ncbi:response regulator [Enterococcus sp. 669A]|uniref:Response regulator n=1 Tax=Candidatus Enterococcus moelleringii TaxID=2815325 RepID=A0ABS3LA05_9ENTE|nr:response regulator [Enterococcus sp. 669A]MBO1306460.1 response regulator [Enterococcus sp. 669A]